MPAQRLTVERESRGERLDRYLTRVLSGTSLEHIRALIEAGHIRIAGKQCQASRKLWGGEEIEVTPPEPRKVAAVEGPELPILYEDADVVIVNKPAHLVVEPESNRASVVGLLATRLQGFDVAGEAQPGVVHRLDKETSGCLVLARTDEAVGRLKRGFDEKQIEKRYWAFVLGNPPENAKLNTPYARDPKDPRKFTTKVQSPRRAVLSIFVRERFKDAAWIEIKLDTGRTHQIRVQLAEAGFPVLGDAVYGPKPAREHPVAQQLGHHALHACRLTLRLKDPPIEVESPLPEEMQRALDTLRTQPLSEADPASTP